MPKRIVYAVYDKGVLVCECTPLQVSEILGLPQENIAEYVHSGMEYKGRYTVERLKQLNMDIVSWRREWDETRLKILAAGR